MGALRNGEAIAERRLEIAQRYAPAVQIKVRGERAGDTTQLHGDRTRQTRDEKRKQAHPEPLQLVAQGFPG